MRSPLFKIPNDQVKDIYDQSVQSHLHGLSAKYYFLVGLVDRTGPSTQSWYCLHGKKFPTSPISIWTTTL
jgi:hypothetical protein